MEQRRRRIPREDAGWPGRYRFEGDARGEWGNCRVIDISLLGVGIELFGSVPSNAIGRRVTVEVETPAGASVLLQLAGVCRHTSPGREGGTRTGIEFTGLSETERSILEIMGHMQIVW